IDRLVLDIPGIGDQIEKGLLIKGPQGEAMIRQALGDAGSGLGSIFQMGMEQGFSPQAIMDMLGPVYGSIQQEMAGAAARIQTEDWTAGFGGRTAAELQQWMAGILDPNLIGNLFANVSGADSQVSGLQSQLAGLRAQLSADVEFSPEQVQAAMDEIQTTVTTTPLVTEEAAQAIYDEIQSVLDNDDLEAAIDQAQITQGIMDAAQAAEDQISLVFDSALSFNSEELYDIARMVGADFYAAFTEQLKDERARQYGFENYSQMQAALGPAVTDAMMSTSTTTVEIDAPITVTGAPTPEATAAETVRALSAASGSGGYMRGTPSGGNRYE
ncbi:MAG: hypothetical protein LC687_05160, partial [Actinobacteria bacterium]|nr:hypothetical protein [Actinomycetota bacterium]